MGSVAVVILFLCVLKLCEELVLFMGRSRLFDVAARLQKYYAIDRLHVDGATLHCSYLPFISLSIAATAGGM